MNFWYIIQVNAASVTHNANISHNINQGKITLFSQNYSEIDNNGLNGVFIAKINNDSSIIFDVLYPLINGIHRSEIMFDNTSPGLTYTTTRESYHLPGPFKILEITFDFLVDKHQEYFMETSDKYSFCRGASIPASHCGGQPRQSGSLYITNFVPMVKTNYQISMNIHTDSPDSFIEIDSPGSRLIIQEIGNNTVLKSYYENSFGDLRSKKIFIGNAAEKLTFNILFDGYNKTNTIYSNNGTKIITPFYKKDRQNLPYIDFSSEYIKITDYIIGQGRYLNVNIFQIIQTSERKLITAIGDKNMSAFGLDGPHPKNTIEKGVNYLESKGGKGTIWIDVSYVNNDTDGELVEYIHNLSNNSWDLGMHYSKELDKLPLEQAYNLMEKEYLYVYEIFGRKPTSWCSLRNNDNVTHAKYAYDYFGMIWRNGDAGINAETENNAGNLADNNWIWWKTVSNAGMVYPVFTHRTDEDPSIGYSISFPKFQNWVNNYDSNNVSIVSFYEYWQTNSNTYHAYFDNIVYSSDYISFDAHTNGAKALINVNIIANNDTRILDNSSGRSIDYKAEQDKSITFWVENRHNYIIDI